jgi:hypothetical protein
MPGTLDPTCFTCDGELFINSQSMMTTAWAVTDLLDLANPIPTLRGTDLIIPTAAGRRPYRRRIDETRYSLPFSITGTANTLGVVYSDWRVGLETNLNSLATVLGVGGNTVPATITKPSGATLAADIFVTALKFGARAGPLVLATLEITIPAGRFT